MASTDWDKLVHELEKTTRVRRAAAHNMLMRKTGRALNQARTEAGMSLRELAAEANTSLSQVQRVVSNRSGASTTLRTLVDIADAMGLRVVVSLERKNTAAMDGDDDGVE